MRATDAGADWLVCIGPDRRVVSREPEPGEAACSVRGRACELYLVLWNRLAPHGLEVRGDAALWTCRATRWACAGADPSSAGSCARQAVVIPGACCCPRVDRRDLGCLGGRHHPSSSNGSGPGSKRLSTRGSPHQSTGTRTCSQSACCWSGRGSTRRQATVGPAGQWRSSTVDDETPGARVPGSSIRGGGR